MRHAPAGGAFPALEATQGQMDGFFSQPPDKCLWHLREMNLRFALNSTPGRRGTALCRLEGPLLQPRSCEHLFIIRVRECKSRSLQPPPSLKVRVGV